MFLNVSSDNIAVPSCCFVLWLCARKRAVRDWLSHCATQDAVLPYNKCSQAMHLQVSFFVCFDISSNFKA